MMGVIASFSGGVSRFTRVARYTRQNHPHPAACVPSTGGGAHLRQTQWCP